MSTDWKANDSAAGEAAKPEPPPVDAQLVSDLPDELRLSPPDCPSRDEFLGQISPVTMPEPPTIRVAPKFQFRVFDVMIATVGVAVGLAGGTWMPADYFAGIMGILMLGGMIVTHFIPPESRGARLAWGTFILAYFVAVIAAVWRVSNA